VHPTAAAPPRAFVSASPCPRWGSGHVLSAVKAEVCAPRIKAPKDGDWLQPSGHNLLRGTRRPCRRRLRHAYPKPSRRGNIPVESSPLGVRSIHGGVRALKALRALERRELPRLAS
jgi:hypothetical protein